MSFLLGGLFSLFFLSQISLFVIPLVIILISVVLLVTRKYISNSINAMVQTNQDIANQHLIQIENTQHYQQILDSIADLILVKKEHSAIVWANKAFREYYGMTNEQLKDMIDSPAVEPDHTLQYIKDDTFVFESGKVLNIPEEPVTKHDGVVRLFETVKAPIFDRTGKVVMTVGVSRDITERKLAEDSLKKAYEELQVTQIQILHAEKMASIGQLAAGVAHEINNPMSFISNNVEILVQYINDYNTMINLLNQMRVALEQDNIELSKTFIPEIQQAEKTIQFEHIKKDINVLLEHTQKGILRVQKIVLDLRAFSREDNDVQEKVHIEEVIDGVLDIVHNELKYKVDLTKEYTHTPILQCSPQRIGQVFINLLVNAVQAIKEKGQINIRTFVENDFIVVEIKDTGSGISPENIKRIFDPFFTTKPVGQGTGLGLSVSYEIIKKHNGQIKVSSTPNVGTVFTVLLPFIK